ncbi:DUF1501 domain-containing protein [Lignipirellula cremea]|uniref:Sulfatase n=1 Tax=Lignipirellula cremea TaxID=2528010 RepID=A0A518DMN3_9BACT|nr:DUF1501 domain-containing protein [Lignipirellula cremea]QDU93104.1 hypothetical protein Pla8534_08830 [Lignipirellula cremea]
MLQLPVPQWSRRQMLSHCGAGLGLAGLAAVLQQHGALAAEPASAAGSSQGAAPSSAHPLAARPGHFPGRAKRVIQILANGGPSQVDTFDPKPELTRRHGERLPLHFATERPTGAALSSPFTFQKYGESGLEASELFDKLASNHADDLCVVRSMYTDAPIHENSLRLMNCGAAAMSRPSIGSWVTYGLGTENQNLPGFVVLVPQGMPVAGADNWQSSFLPGAYQGAYLETLDRKPSELIDNLQNPLLSRGEQKAQLDFLQSLNQMHFADRGEPDLEARIHSFETAFRMQTEATDAFDIDREPADVQKLYGESAQAKQMLIARRLVERGVRFVQVWHGTLQPWDSHNDIARDHRRLAKECDQGLSGLLTDLKNRGMLDDTLVIWGGEFGRTPTVELTQDNKLSPTAGRDHNNHGFTMWLAGGGVRGGITHGATDEFGFRAIENRVHVHDLQATVLHLLGLNHEKLTFRHSGRDFRLTDVHGRVLHELLV